MNPGIWAHWSQQTKRPVTLEEETRVPRWEQPSTRGGLARWFRPPRFQRGPCAGSDPRSPHWIAARASEQVPCLNHVSLQMMPLPHLLKRNLTYLNCPKSLASSHISKDTGPSLGAPHPSPLPRLGRLSSQTPGVPPPQAPGSVHTGQAGHMHPRTVPAFPVGTLPQPLTSLAPRSSGPSSQRGTRGGPPRPTLLGDRAVGPQHLRGGPGSQPFPTGHVTCSFRPGGRQPGRLRVPRWQGGAEHPRACSGPGLRLFSSRLVL